MKSQASLTLRFQKPGGVDVLAVTLTAEQCKALRCAVRQHHQASPNMVLMTRDIPAEDFRRIGRQR